MFLRTSGYPAELEGGSGFGEVKDPDLLKENSPTKKIEKGIP
jgi:hypothetical protein